MAPEKQLLWVVCKVKIFHHHWTCNSAVIDLKMPAKIKVRIVAARDLPVMDRSSDLADAFAEVRNL